MPGPIQTFEGVGNVNGVVPPDPVGDVGPSHYVQMVNISFAVYSKTGTVLFGPANNNTLWAGFGGVCELTNRGDAIVVYDPLADRWIMSQFGFTVVGNDPVGPFYECIAVSQTSSPLGAWHRYAFQISLTKFNDYPKLGVWPDAYYMSVNEFSSPPCCSFDGAAAVAFERDQMLAGMPADMVYFDLPPSRHGMLPSDLDGPTPPPVGAANAFLQVNDNAPTDGLEVWNFRVDWGNPSNSTFTPAPFLSTSPFDSLFACGGSGRDCIPQPGPPRSST